MLNVQFDRERVNALKDIYIRLRNEDAIQSVKEDVNHFIEDVGVVGLLLIKQVLLHADDGITVEDVKRFLAHFPELIEHTIKDDLHPVHVFKRENRAFQVVLNQILSLLKRDGLPTLIEELQEQVYYLGQFHKHYHRKEKLIFAILERYGHDYPARVMWKKDDRIRALYQGVKRRVDELSDTNLNLIAERYDLFKDEFENMIFQEETILLPILIETFSEEDWAVVAEESEAFGYAMIEVQEVWKPEMNIVASPEKNKSSEENLVFGGGYLTHEEANLILNHLPLEITFVDRNSVFKYFNDMTKASEMMLIRTPSSIGRNVSNCHPPKSLKKVMTLIRDLKAGKRTSESMWFKKKGKYVHLTYKALFNDEGEYLGILEYVQDIQPFFELPEEIKLGLSRIED